MATLTKRPQGEHQGIPDSIDAQCRGTTTLCVAEDLSVLPAATSQHLPAIMLRSPADGARDLAELSAS